MNAISVQMRANNSLVLVIYHELSVEGLTVAGGVWVGGGQRCTSTSILLVAPHRWRHGSTWPIRKVMSSSQSFLRT